MDISLNPQTALFVQHKLASGSYRSVSWFSEWSIILNVWTGETISKTGNEMGK